MRADRVLAMLLLLQARGRVTASELANRLEVSRRTVYRDMVALSAAGVPVHADPGPNGGIELMAGWRTDLTGLTASEVEALFHIGCGSSVRKRHGQARGGFARRDRQACRPDPRATAGRLRRLGPAQRGLASLARRSGRGIRGPAVAPDVPARRISNRRARRRPVGPDHQGRSLGPAGRR